MPANQQGYIVLKGWSICSGGHRLFAPAEGGQYTPAETGFSIRLFHNQSRAVGKLVQEGKLQPLPAKLFLEEGIQLG